jgi:RNA polymerase sigma factor for flagellar operon FliA
LTALEGVEKGTNEDIILPPPLELSSLVFKAGYIIRRITQEDIDELHQRLFKDRDSDAFNILAEYYCQDFAKRCVWRSLKKHHLPEYFESDDLYCEIVFELLKLLRRYDPSKGAKFETYANIRLGWEVVDCMREESNTPRSVHKAMKSIKDFRDEFYKINGRNLDHAELCQLTGMTMEKILEVENIYYSDGFPVSLDQLIEPDDSGDSPMDPSQFIGRYEDEYLEIENRAFFDYACKQLEGRSKELIVIQLHYLERLTLKEISGVMGLSEARISQLHSQAIGRIRSKLTKRDWILLGQSLPPPKKPVANNPDPSTGMVISGGCNEALLLQAPATDITTADSTDQPTDLPEKVEESNIGIKEKDGERMEGSTGGGLSSLEDGNPGEEIVATLTMTQAKVAIYMYQILSLEPNKRVKVQTSAVSAHIGYNKNNANKVLNELDELGFFVRDGRNLYLLGSQTKFKVRPNKGGAIKQVQLNPESTVTTFTTYDLADLLGPKNDDEKKGGVSSNKPPEWQTPPASHESDHRVVETPEVQGPVPSDEVVSDVVPSMLDNACLRAFASSFKTAENCVFEKEQALMLAESQLSDALIAYRHAVAEHAIAVNDFEGFKLMMVVSTSQ